jgi:predicted DNA-binding transcriptional regulator YafY
LDKFDRIYALHKLLSGARRPVPRTQIEEALRCKRSTVGRIIDHMRYSMCAPIAYDYRYNGWYYDKKTGEHPYELPGLWFNAGELQALAILSHLIRSLQPGLLEEQLRPFQKRIDEILAYKRFGNGELERRIRLLGIGLRRGGDTFQKVAEGVLQRKRLAFDYHSRSKDEIVARVVSPQRLVRYRDNWYLDAWCHLRNELRNFSLDRLRGPQVLKQPAKSIDDKTLDGHFAAAYGIFAGRAEHTAILHFSPYRARWVAEETWHPQQEGRFLENGGYELRIPYGHLQELVMDILKYGPDVEVIGPEPLRRAVEARVAETLRRYE